MTHKGIKVGLLEIFFKEVKFFFLTQDLVTRTLHVDPQQRWTASQVIHHPWLNKREDLPNLRLHLQDPGMVKGALSATYRAISHSPRAPNLGPVVASALARRRCKSRPQPAMDVWHSAQTLSSPPLVLPLVYARLKAYPDSNQERWAPAENLVPYKKEMHLQEGADASTTTFQWPSACPLMEREADFTNEANMAPIPFISPPESHSDPPLQVTSPTASFAAFSISPTSHRKDQSGRSPHRENAVSKPTPNSSLSPAPSKMNANKNKPKLNSVFPVGANNSGKSNANRNNKNNAPVSSAKNNGRDLPGPIHFALLPTPTSLSIPPNASDGGHHQDKGRRTNKQRRVSQHRSHRRRRRSAATANWGFLMPTSQGHKPDSTSNRNLIWKHLCRITW